MNFKLSKNRVYQIFLFCSLLAIFPCSFAVRWSYSGDTGPAYWGKLDKAYRMCDIGLCQSPIDIPNATISAKNKIIFNYQTDSFLRKLDWHGFSVDALNSKNEYILVNGQKYRLLGFHFHTPAEHTVHGKHYPLEIYLFHANSHGKFLVVSVLAQRGKKNTDLNGIFSKPLPRIDAVVDAPVIKFNPGNLLKDREKYYMYLGSLTTPPCTENVTWIVMKHPITLSNKQLKFMKAYFGGPDARPVQPLNGRQVSG